MRIQGCLIVIIAMFFLLVLGGCRSFLKCFDATPTATISATMKTSLKPSTGSYQLRINKIILCDGYDKYLALGEITKLFAQEAKEQHLEDTVTFMGPVKPIQYFLILNKQVQQELQNHLGPHPYQVIESEDDIKNLKPLQPQQTGVAPMSEKERTSVGDCKIFFIRQ